MAEPLQELVQFLSDRRIEVRKHAVEIVLGLTGSPTGVDQLRSELNPLLSVLLRLAVDVPDVSCAALSSLINLAQDPDVVERLVAQGIVGRIMDYIREKTCPHVRLLIMLLANVTTSDRGCELLVQLGQGKLEGLHMAVLLKHMVMSGITHCEGEPDPYEHVAAIAQNVTRLEPARKLLLQPGRGLLQALASQLQAPSLVRRQGSMGAIRNCCLSAQQDGTLDSLVQDVEVLKRLLRPINGEEPKEADDVVRELAAEAVLLLAGTPTGLQVLRAAGGWQAVKKGYEYEEHPGVCKALEAAARCFMEGDEELAEAAVGAQGGLMVMGQVPGAAPGEGEVPVGVQRGIGAAGREAIAATASASGDEARNSHAPAAVSTGEERCVVGPDSTGVQTAGVSTGADGTGSSSMSGLTTSSTDTAAGSRTEQVVNAKCEAAHGTSDGSHNSVSDVTSSVQNLELEPHTRVHVP